MVKENEKPRALEQELEQVPDEARIIVFANTKRQVGARAAARAAWGLGGDAHARAIRPPSPHPTPPLDP